MYMIKTLWVGGNESSSLFIANARQNSIDITCAKSLKDAKRRMGNYNHEKWQAVIINAECSQEEGGEISIEYAITASRLAFKSEIPYFFLSEGNPKVQEALDGLKEKYYLDHNPENIRKLFKDIIDMVGATAEGIVQDEFEDIISIGNEKITTPLKGILVKRQNGNIQRDNEIPHTIRGVIEAIMDEMNEKGIIRFDDFRFDDFGYEYRKKPGPPEWSRYIDRNKNWPQQVKRSFEYLTKICPAASHNTNDSYITDAIRDGKAIYLNESLICCLLNIMEWYSSFINNK